MRGKVNETRMKILDTVIFIIVICVMAYLIYKPFEKILKPLFGKIGEIGGNMKENMQPERIKIKTVEFE